MIMKTLINKKTIGNKRYISQGSLVYENGVVVKIIESNEYRTNGENLLLVRNTLSSKIILDSSTTTSITIKALTNTIIKPFMGKIDEEFDEILMNKGASVEFFNINNNWYILSSDGLKLDN